MYLIVINVEQKKSKIITFQYKYPQKIYCIKKKLFHYRLKTIIESVAENMNNEHIKYK